MGMDRQGQVLNKNKKRSRRKVKQKNKKEGFFCLNYTLAKPNQRRPIESRFFRNTSGCLVYMFLFCVFKS